MDKQQLAKKIWDAATAMRGTVNANDYKDAVLGLIFYKFLSDKEVEYFTKQGMPDELLEKELVPTSQARNIAIDDLGYFIAYDDLFSTWLKKKSRMTDQTVSDALKNFDTNYDQDYAHLFDGIFKSFRSVIGKLSNDSGERASLLRKLARVVSDIPTTGKHGYDTLGYIYEYLIGKFAANAGQSAGEFYTPHEVARVMAELVDHHSRDKDTLQVYDPTSGSASLLLNIGDVIETNSGKNDSIKYFAQELMEDAYNLTRMNLFMRGVLPANIVTRRADSLKVDWPKEDGYGNFSPLLVDAVVSNPPYSATWARELGEGDPRFSYGLAPKKPADYAFVLHELYHLKDDGIMTVVLPHGVLFRKSHEETIRKALVDNFHIETIIGFPSGIFFGTGISTLVMVLKKKREDTDILFVDASQGFAKVGTEVFLRPRDVRKIVDTVVARKDVDNYARRVSYDEIVRNGYNLNIPRYVDSSASTETFDIYATMYGGIPQYEIDEVPGLGGLEGLRGDIFDSLTETHTGLKVTDVAGAVHSHASVADFLNTYTAALDGFDDRIFDEVFDNATTMNASHTEETLRNELFARVEGIDVVDQYALYEIFASAWKVMDNDLDVIKAHGWEVARDIEVLTEIDPDSDDAQEKVVGYEGRLIPLDIARSVLFADSVDQLDQASEKVTEIEARLSALLNSLEDEDAKKTYSNKKGDGFDKTAVTAAVKQARAEVTTEEIAALEAYLEVPSGERAQFMKDTTEVDWSVIDQTVKGVAKLPPARARIKQLRQEYTFAAETLESTLAEALALLNERTAVNRDIKTLKNEIESNLHEAVRTLSDDQVRILMKHKWIDELTAGVAQYPLDVLNDMIARIEYLDSKYAVTLGEVGERIAAAGKSVASLLDQMTGSEKDMAGIKALSALIGGGK